MFQIARPEETQPEFLVPIQDLTIREGETARFDCQVKSLPEATLVWYHQNKPIKSDDIFQIVPGEDGQSSLIIAEAFPEDSGEYTVRAINRAGETECSAVLTVEGMWKLCPFRANDVTCRGAHSWVDCLTHVFYAVSDSVCTCVCVKLQECVASHSSGWVCWGGGGRR